MEPEPILIRDGACHYRILKPIGIWGPSFNLTVYEAVILPETNNLPHVALKMVSRTDEMEYYHDSAVDDIARLKFFHALPHTILPIKKYFYAPLNNVQNHCTVMFFDAEVTSLRSLISSRPMFAGGIPQTCIAIALNRTLVGLSEIHYIEDVHDQITAGSIFYHQKDETIKLAYAASLYERTVNDPTLNPNQEAPVNLMWEWARAPEVEQDGDLGMDTYINNSNKSDIWLIGIVALELAYGKIPVANREEMLNIASYISNKRILPDSWEELRMKAAGAQITEDSVSRFTVTFGQFVGRCLAFDPERRPLTNMLWNHVFLKKNGGSMTYFDNLVVKGLSPPVGRAASERKKKYRKLSRVEREIRTSMLRRRRSNLALMNDKEIRKLPRVE